jgi:hypothetical protein
LLPGRNRECEIGQRGTKPRPVQRAERKTNRHIRELELIAQRSRQLYQEARANFVDTELSLAITFSQLALSACSWDTAQRNRNYAKQAYLAALRFLDTERLIREENQALGEKIAEFKDLMGGLRKPRKPGK